MVKDINSFLEKMERTMTFEAKFPQRIKISSYFYKYMVLKKLDGYYRVERGKKEWYKNIQKDISYRQNNP